MSELRSWDLNAVALAHVNRFFQAARRATVGLEDKRMTSLLALTGNLLWAHSSFSGAPEHQEKAMAIVGGTAGTLAGEADLGGGERRKAAEAALDELECDLLGRMDAIVELLWGEIVEAGLAGSGPATINAWAWNRLFPGYPWPAGQGELEDAIRARL